MVLRAGGAGLGYPVAPRAEVSLDDDDSRETRTTRAARGCRPRRARRPERARTGSEQPSADARAAASGAPAALLRGEPSRHGAQATRRVRGPLVLPGTVDGCRREDGELRRRERAPL